MQRESDKVAKAVWVRIARPTSLYRWNKYTAVRMSEQQMPHQQMRGL